MNNYWDDLVLTNSEYSKYYHKYVKLVPKGNVISLMNDQMEEVAELIQSLTPKQSTFRYQPGKWSVKEVIGHLTDTERIFGTRALCFSRNENQELPGYDQDQYVEQANFNERTLKELSEEYTAVRKSSISLFNSCSPSMLNRKGIAENKPITVRSIPFIVIGHERHHLNILREKYHLK